MKVQKKSFNFIQWLAKNRNLLFLIGILFLSIILRFYNYTNRWGLAADQARDVLVVREALRMHKLPLIGPFSASGPYVFGPFWYWALLIPIGLFRNYLLAPWLFLTSLYVVSVYVTYLLGKKLVDTRFGLLTSLFAAISPAEIQLSTNLIMSSFVGFLSVSIFYCFVSYIKEKRLRDLSIMALLIGLAINTHFEAVPLVILILFALLLGHRNRIHAITGIISFAVPFIPLVIFNWKDHSYELTHIFLTNAPKQHLQLIDTILEIAKREFVFLSYTLPKEWGWMTTGFGLAVGYAALFLVSGSLILTFHRHRLQKEIGIFSLIAVIIFAIVGSYSGVLYGNFLAYLNPLFFVLTTWMCLFVVKNQKYTGILLIIAICILALYSDVKTIKSSTNSTALQAYTFEHALNTLYPKQKFSVYEHDSFLTKDDALALSLFLYYDKKISGSGLKIGIAHIGAPVNHQVIFDDIETGLRIYNFGSEDNVKLAQEHFIPYNPGKIYASVENWYK